MRRVQERSTLRPDRTTAVNNDLNDLPMLDAQVASLTAAPEDARPAVVDAVAGRGGSIGRGPEPHGVLDALRAVGLGQPLG